MYLCLCWCCAVCAIEGTQHSNQHSGMLAAAWVLPVRAAIAMCARGGLASGRLLGEWRTHHCVVEIGGVEKHLECRSTVSRGHFRTGTHGHLHLSHFLHDLDTFMRVRGRAAGTRRH